MPRHTSAEDAEAAAPKRLDSWKAIAAYLNCGVRTVQRWEKTEGLPVQRHLHQTQATVYAFVSDVDRWREQRADLVARTDAADADVSEQGLGRFVGRDNELDRLDALWSRVLNRGRQTVFVAGEIGIGKTLLVKAFIDQLEGTAWIIEGHCVEQYGAGEAFLPVLEGLAKFRRRPDARSAAALLARHASSWMPHIANNPGGNTVPPAGNGAPRIVELIDAIEQLARDRPVVLFFDDLHWSDWSTAELIDRIARRNDSARILVIGTYRPDDLAFRQHPLLRIQHELRVHQRCEEIQVPRFAEPEIAEYLRDRGIDKHVQRATSQLRKWTGGNPLFLNIVFDHLVAQGCVTPAEGVCDLQDPMATPPSMPSTLYDIVDDRIQRLTAAERRLLEAASIVGPAFSAAVVAAAVATDVEHAERVFDSLARRHQFVARTGVAESAGQPPAATYAFLHSLYATVLYDGLSPHARVVLHRAIAAWLEQAATAGREGVAAELAMHCERAHDFERAVTYYEAAAATALSRSAYHEAHRCAVKALEHLTRTPAAPDRDKRELNVRLKICAALSGMSTMADPRVITAFRDALSLSERMRDEAELIPVLLGIVRFDLTRGNVALSLETANRAVAIARKAGEPVQLIASLQHAATSYSISGDYAAAIEQLDEALSVNAGDSSGSDLIATAGFGPLSAAMTVRSGMSWCVGLPDTAIRFAYAAIARAQQLAHPQTIAFVKAWLVWTLEFCGVAEGRVFAESALATATQLELPMVAFFAEGVLGWIRARSSDASGIDLIRNALTFQAGAGIRVWVPLMQAWLAEGLLIAGDADGAIAAAADGLATSAATGAHWYDSELHGLAAEGAALAMQRASEAERPRLAARFDTHIRQSTAIAQAQRARSFELRAAMRRVRAAEIGAAVDSAREELSRVYGSFSEGFDTPDLIAARALIASAVDGNARRRG
ncbi:MAG: AAA family ATPase [Acidobacteria bacterium]|nr:AAA family ATPase [Acidobacteriota bacterium]